MRNDAGEAFLVTTFVLPHDRGRIHRIQGASRANRQADKIFRSYQEQAANGELDFRRFPLQAVSTTAVDNSDTRANLLVASMYVTLSVPNSPKY